MNKKSESYSNILDNNVNSQSLDEHNSENNELVYQTFVKKRFSVEPEPKVNRFRVNNSKIQQLNTEILEKRLMKY